MHIRFYPSRKREKGNALALLLRDSRLDFELIRADELKGLGKRLYGAHEDPFVEIDGEIFVNPNPQALRKMLLGEIPAET